MQTNLKEKVKFLLNTAQIGNSKDFTAEEKQTVFAHFEPYGLQTATCRNRFFRDGWAQWELRGILGCIADFSTDRPELEAIAIEAAELPITAAVADAQDICHRFYEALSVKAHFTAYMEERGISHTSTTAHFRNPMLFQAWELFGINRIFESF